MTLDDVIQIAIDGFCDRTLQEYAQTKDYKAGTLKRRFQKAHEPER
jgi:hypothetical protein